jgi:hypothetical protein
MLRESPASRPNIYQVLREACLMQGREVPVKDVSINVKVQLMRTLTTIPDLLCKVAVRA